MIHLFALSKDVSGYAKDIWSAAIPPKIKIFTWKLACNRLPTNEQLANGMAPPMVCVYYVGYLKQLTMFSSIVILLSFSGAEYARGFRFRGTRILFAVLWFVKFSLWKIQEIYLGQVCCPELGLVENLQQVLKGVSLNNLLIVRLNLLSCCSNGDHSQEVWLHS
jgi:hypothetical protein